MEMEMFNMLTQSVGSIGFPIFCCWYFMTKINATLDELKQAINNNTNTQGRVLEALHVEEGEKD